MELVRGHDDDVLHKKQKRGSRRSDYNGLKIESPSHLTQRIKVGTTKAWEYHVSVLQCQSVSKKNGGDCGMSVQCNVGEGEDYTTNLSYILPKQHEAGGRVALFQNQIIWRRKKIQKKAMRMITATNH